MISFGRCDIKMLLEATNDVTQRALTVFRANVPGLQQATSQVVPTR